jgi:hypothetical protein
VTLLQFHKPATPGPRPTQHSECPSTGAAAEWFVWCRRPSPSADRQAVIAVPRNDIRVLDHIESPDEPLTLIAYEEGPTQPTKCKTG